MTNIKFQPLEWPQSIVEIDALARASKIPDEKIDDLWRVHDLMAKLFSGRYRGSGRPFLNHLAGTAGLALIHGCDSKIVLAGYAHAAYAQGEFGGVIQGATEVNRKTLRAVIGDEAEALVFAYKDFDWLAQLEQFSSATQLSVSDQDRSLLLVRFVNELEDSMDFSVYDKNGFEQCLSRLSKGAAMADWFGDVSLAAQMRKQISDLRGRELVNNFGLRPKRSQTIANLQFMLKPGVKIGRKAKNLFSRLRRR